ncbi:MAG: fimbrillin family protein [Muribaculaceae bacterium]|nr:fimbrillin family protein [Muribaculaceae bacterium]
MKKCMILAVIISSICTACNEDEVVDRSNGHPIDFRAETGSRGNAFTAGSLTSFVVSAFNGTTTHIDKVEFTKAEDSNFYTSSTNYYWPSDDATLSFVAFAPAEGSFSGTVTLTASEQKINNYTLNDNIANHKDIVYASATGKKSTNETTGVALNFKHAVSRICIFAKNSGANVYKVAGIKLGNIAASGDFNFKTEQWTPSTTKASYKSDFTSSPITLTDQKTSIVGKSGSPQVIPHKLTAWNPSTDPTNENNGSYLAVLVNISNAAGKVLFPQNGTENDYAWVAVPIDTEWKIGTIYNYNLDFTDGAGLVDPEEPTPDGPKPGEPVFGSPITFTVTVQGWTEVTETPDMTN